MCWLNHSDRDGLGWLHRGDVSVVEHHELARLTALDVKAPPQHRLLLFGKDAQLLLAFVEDARLLLLASGEVNTVDWQGLLHPFVAGCHLDGMERTLSTSQRALAHVTLVKTLQRFVILVVALSVLVR